ncbi:uncharacterized protein F4807DRAFT_472542 [Annulohypoxylon truncatum]|uniref:uncharacterized protein n=1 Tax=Annulohypoxylon truncatum TaxID=327061 RepID=UPI0020073779|nr:uncharacterized protein F4807DRAFT_472542 [Annulohypoxylon truncatum]KAI1212280.1 hypothetical protein F4807DRAFT_472542 [Annulohypoxylon truncatum]
MADRANDGKLQYEPRYYMFSRSTVVVHEGIREGLWSQALRTALDNHQATVEKELHEEVHLLFACHKQWIARTPMVQKAIELNIAIVHPLYAKEAFIQGFLPDEVADYHPKDHRDADSANDEWLDWYSNPFRFHNPFPGEKNEEAAPGAEGSTIKHKLNDDDADEEAGGPKRQRVTSDESSSQTLPAHSPSASAPADDEPELPEPANEVIPASSSDRSLFGKPSPGNADPSSSDRSLFGKPSSGIPSLPSSDPQQPQNSPAAGATARATPAHTLTMPRALTAEEAAQARQEEEEAAEMKQIKEDEQEFKDNEQVFNPSSSNSSESESEPAYENRTPIYSGRTGEMRAIPHGLRAGSVDSQSEDEAEDEENGEADDWAEADDANDPDFDSSEVSEEE